MTSPTRRSSSPAGRQHHPDEVGERGLHRRAGEEHARHGDPGANQGSNPRSTLSPNVVVVEDFADATAFWNTFDLVGLGAVTLPAGADRVRVDVHTGGRWIQGTAAATAALPTGTDVTAVDGIRFTFTRADGALFSNTLPAANWSASAAFTVKVRDAYRDASGPVSFDHTVTNTQSSQSTRVDGNDSALKQASAQIALTQGTHQIAVNKLSNNGDRLVSVGSPVPFDLTFQNTGTGFLTVSELTDTLPVQLDYLTTRRPCSPSRPTASCRTRSRWASAPTVARSRSRGRRTATA